MEEAVLKGMPAFSSSFAFQSCLPQGPTFLFPEEADVWSPEVQGLYITTCLPKEEVILNYFMAHAAKTTINTPPTSSFSFLK